MLRQVAARAAWAALAALGSSSAIGTVSLSSLAITIVPVATLVLGYLLGIGSKGYGPLANWMAKPKAPPKAKP